MSAFLLSSAFQLAVIGTVLSLILIWLFPNELQLLGTHRATQIDKNMKVPFWLLYLLGGGFFMAALWFNWWLILGLYLSSYVALNLLSVSFRACCGMAFFGGEYNVNRFGLARSWSQATNFYQLYANLKFGPRA